MKEKRRPHLELHQGLFRYHVCLVGANGEIMMTSEAYWSRGNALRAIENTAEVLALNWVEAQ